jgi:hypothetical protein
MAGEANGAMGSWMRRRSSMWRSTQDPQQRPKEDFITIYASSPGVEVFFYLGFTSPS